MTAHELARVLLDGPDLPMATHALNNTFISRAHDASHGALKVGVLATYAGDHIIVGNLSRRALNQPNWYVKEMLVGEAPENWPY